MEREIANFTPPRRLIENFLPRSSLEKSSDIHGRKEANYRKNYRGGGTVRNAKWCLIYSKEAFGMQEDLIAQLSECDWAEYGGGFRAIRVKSSIRKKDISFSQTVSKQQSILIVPSTIFTTDTSGQVK